MNINPGKTEFTEAEHVALRQQVRARMTALDMAQAEVARQADVAPATLSQYLSDTYPNETGKAKAAAALTRWLKSVGEQEALRRQMPAFPMFIPMVASGRITTALRYARAAGDLVIVAGAPGTGKTSTAKQFQADNPRTWVAEMDTTTSGAPMMLLEILAAMGEPEFKGPPATLRRRICQLADEAPGLLIIDEAQHLSDKAIEAARTINDRTGMGVVLLGNEEIYAKVGMAGGSPKFAQVSSRIGHRDHLKEADPRDVVALANGWAQVNDEHIGKPEIAFLQEIAAKPGALRNVSKTFRNALIAARGAGVPLELAHLQGAWARRAGRSR